MIPTYNASSLLKETLAHLSHQEFSTPINWEIVLVDNASTDNTIQVAQEYCLDSTRKCNKVGRRKVS